MVLGDTCSPLTLHEGLICSPLSHEVSTPTHNRVFQKAGYRVPSLGLEVLSVATCVYVRQLDAFCQSGLYPSLPP